jgi:hypothetical protein
MKKVKLFFLVALLLGSLTANAAGTVRTVTSIANDGTGSLRAAFTALAGNGSATAVVDTIRFNSSLKGNTIVLDAVISPGSKNFVLDGGDNNITISGDNKTQIFYSSSSYCIEISNLTFTAGYYSGTGAGAIDLSIQQTGGTYTLNNVRFEGNRRTGSTSAYGGALSIGTNVHAIVNRCTFIDNTLQYTGTPTLTGHYGGGAIYSQGTLEVYNSIFENNSADKGKGGAIIALNLTVVGSVFKNNSAERSGGAIALRTQSTNNPNVKLLGNTFINNHSEEDNAMGGGALGTIVAAGSVVLAANIFQGNTSATNAAYNDFHRTNAAVTFTSAGYNVFKGDAVPASAADTWTGAATDAFDVNDIVDISSYHVYSASTAFNIIPAGVASPLIADVPWPGSDIYGNPTAYGTAPQHAGADQTVMVTTLQNITAEQPDIQHEQAKNIGTSLVGTPALSFENIAFSIPAGLAFTSASATLKEGSAFTLQGVAVGSGENGADTRLQLTVNFAPTAEQEYLDTLTISAAGAYDFVIPLRGAGISWEVASVEAKNFGDIYAGYTSNAQTVTITGSAASGALSYSLKGGQTAVFPVAEAAGYTAAGGNLEIRFAPQAAALYKDTLVISSAGSARTYEIPLEGNGLPRSVVTSDPASLDFGAVAVGLSESKTVTVTLATPVTPLTAANFSLATGKFVIESVTPDPANEVTVTLSFTPLSVQAYLDTLIVRAEYAEECRIPLSGTGFKPVVTSTPASLAFGTTVIGTSKSTTVTVTLTNPVDSLTESAFSLAVAAEGIFELSVAALGEASTETADVVTATVTFQPQADVDYLDTLIVRAAYADEYRIPLSGAGEAYGWSGNPQRNNRITDGKPTGHEFETFRDGSVRFMLLCPPLTSRSTFLQSLDSEGVKQFPDTGKLVTKERTWQTIWVNDLLFVDSEGNSIVAASDLRRTSGTDESYTLYKLSPSGEHLWAEAGIDLNRGVTYGLTGKLGAIQLEDSSYVFTWMSQSGSERSRVELQRLSKDGEFLWENNIVLQESGVSVDYPRLVNAGNNEFILIYIQGKQVLAQKYDSGGTAVWESVTSIYSGAKFPTTVPLQTIINVERGPEGSVFVSWWDYRIDPNKETPYVAHVKADGSLGFLQTPDGERVSYSANRVFSPKMVYDGENNCLYSVFRETNNTQTSQWLTVQKMAMDGELLWETEGIGIESISGTGTGISSYDIQAAGKGQFAVFYLLAASSSKNTTGWATLIDGENGDFVWESEKVGFSTLPSGKSDLRTGRPADNRSWVVSWLDARGSEAIANQSLYVQRINFDGSLGKREIPPCAVPFDLAATGVTSTSASLTWDSDPAGVSWDLRYGVEPASGDDVSYTVVESLVEKSYLLEGLQPATAYVWGVRASCEEGNSSDYAEGDGFNTTVTDIGESKSGSWNVFASGNAINIVNPGKTAIERIQLYDLSGALLKDYPVRTTENVLITASPAWRAVVVKIDGKDASRTHKVVLN